MKPRKLRLSRVTGLLLKFLNLLVRLDDNNSLNSRFLDSQGFIIVEWIRASLLLLSWAAMSFSDSAGGALYQRIKKQNEI